MAFLIRFSVLIILLGVCGCSTKTKDQYGTRKTHFFDVIFRSDSYEKVFRKYSQKEVVHTDFEPALQAQVTFWAEELRNVYIQDVTQQYRLSRQAARKFKNEQREEKEKYFIFIISADSRFRKWNQLEKREGLWRLTLESPEAHIQREADYIEVISQANQRARYYYKNMSNFNKTYRVRFPRNPFQNLDKIVLHITGPRGHLAFDYKVAAASTPPEVQQVPAEEPFIPSETFPPPKEEQLIPTEAFPVPIEELLVPTEELPGPMEELPVPIEFPTEYFPTEELMDE